jgi:hypothetical protein
MLEPEAVVALPAVSALAPVRTVVGDGAIATDDGSSVATACEARPVSDEIGNPDCAGITRVDVAVLVRDDPLTVDIVWSPLRVRSSSEDLFDVVVSSRVVGDADAGTSRARAVDIKVEARAPTPSSTPLEGAPDHT